MTTMFIPVPSPEDPRISGPLRVLRSKQLLNSGLYHPEDEGGILWNDPDVAVAWPEVGEIILSEKDKNNPTLAECKMEFRNRTNHDCCQIPRLLADNV